MTSGALTRIPDDIIEDIRSHADIVDVVSDYVSLKKRGSNFVGLCPFHSEKTPSFNVNPARGIYKCFGCGVGGDVFKFVSEVEHLSFPEAVRLVGERVGIPVPEPEEPSEEASETESIYHYLRFAADYFFRNLAHDDAGLAAREYLAGRGLSSECVKGFGLGYALDRWDGLLTTSVENHLREDLLEKAGLIIARREGEGYYDRYRNRVVFPILSHVGKVLGFGGRVLHSGDEPKYINSPETTVYNKSRVLYGLYQARQEIRSREEALLVEGYTDVLALHQAGITHAVATCGTALTAEQVDLLGRYARRVVLLYDADQAGVHAAVRAMDLSLSRGVAAYAVALPEGEDPDSFVRSRGGDAVESFLQAHREDLVQFILARSRAAGAMETPEGRADVQRSILRSIAKIPDELVRESYLKHASDVLAIPDMQLRSVMSSMTKAVPARHRRGEIVRRDAPAPGKSKFSGEPPADGSPAGPDEKMLLKLMLEEGHTLVELILSHIALGDFTAGTSRVMAEAFVRMYEDGRVDPTAFIDGSLGEDVRDLAAELMTQQFEPSDNWRRRNISVPRLNEDVLETARSAMTLLKLRRIDEAIATLRRRIYRAEQAGEDVRDLQRQEIELHRAKKNVSERKFISDV